MTETNKQSKVICLGYDDEEEEEEEEENSKMYQLDVENQDDMGEYKLLEELVPISANQKKDMKLINPSRLRSDRINDVNTNFDGFDKYQIKFSDIKSVFSKKCSVSTHLVNSFFNLLRLKSNATILVGCDLESVIRNHFKKLKNIHSVVYIPFIFRYDCIILYYIVIYCIILKL